MPTITTHPTKSTTKTTCYHCGENCNDTLIRKMVYEILNVNDLCQFYEIEEKAGISLKGKKLAQYAYLADEKIVSQLVNFSNY